MKKRTYRSLSILLIGVILCFSSACGSGKTTEQGSANLNQQNKPTAVYQIEIPMSPNDSGFGYIFNSIFNGYVTGNAYANTPREQAPAQNAQTPAAANTPAPTNAPAADNGAGNNQSGNNGAGTPNEETPSASPASDPLEYSKEELVNYFNTCVNKIKTDKPGFTRVEEVTADDIVLSNSLGNRLVPLVKDMILPSEATTDTVNKGQDCTALVSVKNQSYVSHLTAADIQDITIRQEGSGYTITVTMPDAASPAPNSSVYDKIFDYLTIDDIMTTYVPKVGATVDRNNVSTAFTGCTATVTVDSEGRPTHFVTDVSCRVSIKQGSITIGFTVTSDMDATIKVNTSYKDFAW